MLKIAGVALTLFLLSSCITAPVPVEDYTLARTAMDAARAIESARYSAGYWHQAEEHYRRGKAFLDEREYSDAQAEFIQARLAAEKAENSARIIRFKNGEVL